MGKMAENGIKGVQFYAKYRDICHFFILFFIDFWTKLGVFNEFSPITVDICLIIVKLLIVNKFHFQKVDIMLRFLSDAIVSERNN